MRFALINNKRVEAEPNLTGICAGCGMQVIAKCGTQRIHHWAHRSKVCDPWWEPETEWHRNWKSNFPLEWQEVILKDDQTGEKHIADVRTANGLVIEFQHSAISPLVRSSREAFYRNMIWVVDGTRLKREHQRFLLAKDQFFEISQNSFLPGDPGHCLPKAWLASPVPVVFDFRSDLWLSGSFMIRDHLYCLFPVSIGQSVLLEKIPVKNFIDDALNGKSPLRLRSYLNDKSKFLINLQNQLAMLQQMPQRRSTVNFPPLIFK
ncbi:competence protein [Mucilaginibacter corticis]|uniref:Competence protein n=1 Tax=Mucilaginibacter corticis TaxID=2597670 RepID=A0A556M9I2_9SPHI|nr:competence protein CoiA family protein [Mucilaginibacter corticis]TSJ36560.1 competence protein [Mucilaginibacter corticis]